MAAKKPATDNPFLEARDIQNLIDAVRSLTRAITLAEEAEQKRETRRALYDQQQLELARDIAAFAKDIATNTKNMPALLEMLTAKAANGGLHEAADRE